MPAHKKPINTARSETVTVRLDPKIHYLAGIAARETQRTLSSFIERAVRHALTVGTPLEDEPTPGTEFVFKQPKPLQFEAYWDVDESDRFYFLATMRPELLTVPEQRLWKLFRMHMEHTKRKITIASFREFWNDSSINTSHLKEGE